MISFLKKLLHLKSKPIFIEKESPENKQAKEFYTKNVFKCLLYMQRRKRNENSRSSLHSIVRCSLVDITHSTSSIPPFLTVKFYNFTHPV